MRGLSFDLACIAARFLAHIDPAGLDLALLLGAAGLELALLLRPARLELPLSLHDRTLELRLPVRQPVGLAAQLERLHLAGFAPPGELGFEQGVRIAVG